MCNKSWWYAHRGTCFLLYIPTHCSKVLLPVLIRCLTSFTFLIWCISTLALLWHTVHSAFRTDLVTLRNQDFFKALSNLGCSTPEYLCFTLKSVGVISFVPVSGSSSVLPNFVNACLLVLSLYLRARVSAQDCWRYITMLRSPL